MQLTRSLKLKNNLEKIMNDDLMPLVAVPVAAVAVGIIGLFLASAKLVEAEIEEEKE